MAGIFNSAIFNNAVFNVGSVPAAVPTGRGSWDLDRRKKKRGRVIRRSDFETLEAFQAEIAKIPIIQPPQHLPMPTEIIEEEDDEILIALARILH